MSVSLVTFTDLTVHVRMLTRTCDGCGSTKEFPYVRAELADGTTPTWREAEKAREEWWDGHTKQCVPLAHRISA